MLGTEARPGGERETDSGARPTVDDAADDDGGGSKHAEGDVPEHDDWYRWGRVILYAEMALAVLVTAFSLYLAFTGRAGFLT